MPVAALVGLAALASGVALLTNIIAGFSLPLALAIAAACVTLGLTVPIARASPERRAWIGRTALIAAICGAGAVVAYDGSRAILSQLDPSPFNPFEALGVFGRLLVGPGADPMAIAIAGIGFHLLNGTSFALAYTFLFARGGQTSVKRAAVAGMAWGLFLETFQLTLYPGWLDIRFYEEFVRISFLGHLVYGAVLGLSTRWALRRFGSDEPVDVPVQPGTSGG